MPLTINRLTRSRTCTRTKGVEFLSGREMRSKLFFKRVRKGCQYCP